MIQPRFALFSLFVALVLVLGACGTQVTSQGNALPPTTSAPGATVSGETNPFATVVPSAPSVPATPLPVPNTDGTITINANGPTRELDYRLLGTNIPAWLNTDGLVNPTLIERTRHSGTTIVRMPGGSWGNTYRWLDCQLERAAGCTYAARPSDFVQLLRDLDDAEGMWTVAFDETAEEAAALVAFFNGQITDNRPIGVDPRGRDWATVGTWARLRAELGHPDPVGLQLWEVGNEIYGGKADTGTDCAPFGWEDGWTCDGVEYVHGKGEGADRRQGFLEFREKMQAVDPTILVGAVGVPIQREWSNWGNEVIAEAGQAMDFYIVHQYAYFEPPRTMEEALAEPQRTWRVIASDVREGFVRYANGRRVPIAVTEYNLFAFQDYDRDRWMTRAVNMLHLADTIGQMAEYGFAMGNQWNLANGVTESFGNYGLLDAGSLERYPQYYVFPLWERFGPTLLPVSSSFDAQRDLSVYAGRTHDGELSLLVINKTPNVRKAAITLEGVSAVNGGRVDLAEADSLEAMQVRFNGNPDPNNDLSDAPPFPLGGLSPFFTYDFTPYSITLLRLEVTP
ncbi:MAG: alpha-L-arabinofuranosidase [Oscillochloridaceae bacterium umkhey_bin13]